MPGAGAECALTKVFFILCVLRFFYCSSPIFFFCPRARVAPPEVVTVSIAVISLTNVTAMATACCHAAAVPNERADRCNSQGRSTTERGNKKRSWRSPRRPRGVLFVSFFRGSRLSFPVLCVICRRFFPVCIRRTRKKMPSTSFVLHRAVFQPLTFSRTSKWFSKLYSTLCSNMR